MRAALSPSESIEVVFRCHFGMDCVLRRNDASLDEHDVIRFEQVVTFPFHSHISFALEPFQAARYGVAILIKNNLNNCSKWLAIKYKKSDRSLIVTVFLCLFRLN